MNHNHLLHLTGSNILQLVGRIGAALTMLGRSISFWRHIPSNRSKIVKQMVFVGVESIPVVIVVAIFTGMVLALQSGLELARFNLEANVGKLVGASMLREMGPVWTAVILGARVGSAMAAELGTMKVSDEVDALTVMTINPLRYLMMPRLVAMVVMAPILTMIADIVGICGGGIVAKFQLGVAPALYQEHVMWAISQKDLLSGTVKSIVFAATIVCIACFQGLTTQNGAEGVGKAATKTVVFSFLYVLLFDYFITSIFYS